MQCFFSCCTDKAKIVPMPEPEKADKYATQPREQKMDSPALFLSSSAPTLELALERKLSAPFQRTVYAHRTNAHEVKGFLHDERNLLSWETPLTKAVYNSDKDVVKKLVKCMSTEGITAPNQKCFSPLEIAVCHGYAEIVEIICQELYHKRKSVFMHEFAKKAFFTAVSQEHEAIVRILLKYIPKKLINFAYDTHKKKNTPLILAVSKKYINIVTILVECINKKGFAVVNKDGFTAFEIAAYYGYTEIMIIIMKKLPYKENPVINKFMKKALFIAISQGHEDIVKILIEKLSRRLITFASGSKKHTPLILAASKGDTSIVKTLLEYIPVLKEINATDEDGNTALIHATNAGHIKTVQMLLRNMDDEGVKVVNKNGFNALDIAKSNGHNSIVSILCNRIESIKKI